MPKVSQSSFAAGEISPAYYGDPEVSAVGCREVLNMLITQARTLKRRGGFRYVATTKNNGQARLIPYQIPGVGSYVVEAGNAYSRFFKYTSGVPVQVISGTPVEIVTPYGTSVLFDIDHHVAAKTLHLTHGSHHPRTLERTSDTSWTITPNETGTGTLWEDIGPVYEIRKRSVLLNVNATTAGPWRLIYSSESYFTPSMAPANISTLFNIHGGWFEASLYRSPTEMAGTMLTPASNSIDPTADWAGPYTQQPFVTVNLTQDTTSSAGATDCQVTAASATFTAADIGTVIDINAGVSGGTRSKLLLITSFGSPSDTIAVGTLLKGSTTAAAVGTNYQRYTLEDDPKFTNPGFTPSATSGTGQISSDEDYFTASHAGSATEPGARFRINGGVARVTSVADPQTANVTFEKALSTTSKSWTWEEEINLDGGYSRAVTTHQGRLLYGGCSKNPDQFWGSKTEKHAIFETGAEAADAINFNLQDDAGLIQWMASNKDLHIGLEDAEYAVSGAPLTAGQFGADRQSSNGSSRIKPVRLDNEIHYAGLSGKKLFGSLFTFQSDRYDSEELSEKAAHLFSDSTIKEIAVVKRPERIVYVLLNDGALLAFSYLQNRIAGWSTITLGGDATVESICTVRNGSRDDLWCVVNRDIGGTKRYVEVYDPDALTDSFLTQTGLTVTATSISGLAHLAGETVQARLDGAYRIEGVVSAGGVLDISPLNLSGAPATVEVGFGFTYRAKFAPTLSQDAKGPSYSRDQTIKGATFRVKDTLALDYGADLGLSFRETTVDSGSAPALYSGFVYCDGPEAMGDYDDPVFTVGGTAPLPCEILSVTFNTEVGP